MHDPAIEISGTRYLRDGRGALVPEPMIKPVDKLMDETVRKTIGYARDLSAQIGRFKKHTMGDIQALRALIAQDYNASLGGAKGNLSLVSFDGLLKVSVQSADQIVFGPELEAAKHLVDECLMSWADGSRDEIKAVVTHAFQVDKQGQINRAAVFMLLRIDIEDERWRRAMDAIRDSIRVTGSKVYVRFHERTAPDGQWRAIPIDLAQA